MGPTTASASSLAARWASLSSRSPEIGSAAESLLEVVADELVVSAAASLEPRREALVQLGAARLRDALVGGVADQHVEEAEAVLAGIAARRAR